MTNLDREDGFKYEKLVAEYFSKELRCLVINDSILNGKKDGGIDLIAISFSNNNKQIYLIQCKNYCGSKNIEQKEIDRYLQLKNKFVRNALYTNENDNVNLIFCVTKFLDKKDFAYAIQKNIQIMILALNNDGTKVILKNKLK